MTALKLPPPALLNIAQELLGLLQDQAPPNARTGWPPASEQALADLVPGGLHGLQALHRLIDARFGIQLPAAADATDDTIGGLIHAVFRELS